MSKYVKEMMMDQLRGELGDARSMLVLDFKGLDAVSEHRLRMDLRQKSIKVRTLKNTLARRVLADAGVDGLAQFLEGPSVLVWGGDGPAELAKEISAQLKKLKKPQIKGGAVDGVVIGPDQVEDITKLPSREELIGRVAALALAPAQRLVSLANAPAQALASQIQTIAEGAAPAEDAAPAEAAEGGDAAEGA